MINREVNSSAKQENTSHHNVNSKQASITTTTATTTTSWSRYKDPRVVRVSRAFGGKDRHSKVCTVRGLRDRRVRLSVPTAIQLYDLQDRLGVNQPSKVVDWLLSVAKKEIDGLPPLQFPVPTPNHGYFMPCQSAKQGLKISADFSWSDPSKHAPTKPSTSRVYPGDGNDDHDPYNQQNPSSFSSLLAPAFSSWDPPSLTLSQPPISLGLTPQHHQDLDNFTLGPHPHHHHLLVYPQPGFQSLELSNSSVQPVRPFRFSMTADLLPSQNNEDEELHSR